MDDFDFDLLPDDPPKAFVKLERQFRSAMHSELRDEDGNYHPDMSHFRYINRVLTAVHVLGLNILQNWKISESQSYKDINRDFDNFTLSIDAEVLRINLSLGERRNRYSVLLTPADKQKIRHYVEQIKTIIDGVELRTAKKDSLYKKINAFLKDVDQIRTGLETFSDMAIGLAHIGGEAAKELEPARRRVDSIARLMGRNHDIEEAHRELTAPVPLRRIEPPRLQISSPADLDDEIPF